MKIRKRRELLDFGALAEGETSEFEDLDLFEVAPDFDLSPAEPPPTATPGARSPAIATPSPLRGRLPVDMAPQAAPAEAPSPLSEVEAEPETAAAPEPEPEAEPEAEPVLEAEPAAPAGPPEAAPEAPAPEIVASTPAPEPVAPTAQPERDAGPEKATATIGSARRIASVRAQAAAPAPHPVIPTREPPPSKTAPATSFSLNAPRPASGPKATGAPAAWPIYTAAGVVSVLWACAPIAFAWGYRRDVMPFEYDPFALGVFALLAIGPAALIWIAAFLLRQGQLLAQETARARALANDMVSPALIAAGRAGDVTAALREEIARASQTAKDAGDLLLSMRDTLAGESERLTEVTAISARRAQELSAVLGREREEMTGMAQSLEGQAVAVAELISRQTQVVTDASDLAVTQLREAEALLAARAADLTTAAAVASDAARTAGEDLNRHIARLDSAGAGLGEQISAVEAGLAQQRAALTAATQGLRADQEVFAAEAESQTAKLSEFIGHARSSASEMGDRAIKGADALRSLIAEAADQFREFAEQAKAERDAFGASTHESLEAVAEAAAEQRAKLEAQTRAAITALSHAAEETREAAQRHADAARAQVDQLAEAAFSAGQRANQVFETRLDEARELIERSSQMVEQAGAATARKLEEGAAAARGTLQELEQMLGEIEQRASRLPTEARRQAEEVRTAVTRSMDELMDQARRTAEETEAIDQAFQDRVHRNYEMLSEAVRLMGAVATGSGASAAPPSVREARAAAPRLGGGRAAKAEPAAAPAIEAGAKDDSALRPRLKLTPTATDEEFSSVFDAAGGRAEEAAEASDGWTWKELLSSIDSSGGEVSHARIEETLISEIAKMGIDPAALLPRVRVEEVAEMLQAGDTDGGRILVRRLAPAATRRLARRLFTDAALKQQVRKYVARYERLLSDASKRDEDGLELGGLLASDAGRAFLLLDAAAGGAD